MTKLIIIILSFTLGCNVFAQTDLSLVRKGNRQYNENQFNQAEVLYKKSVLKTPNMTQGNYNLGNTYFKQKRYDKAIEQYQKVLANTKDKKLTAQTNHNIGNGYLELFKTENDQQKKSSYIDNSIKAYKNSLINNPNDKDTKYNLSYALALKKQFQQQQQQQQKQQKQQQQKQEEKPKQEQKQELTKEEAEKLLQAIRAQEKDVQERQNKKEEKKKVKIEKEW
jgi:tetratricopeptide (TPR) repeat protein